MSEEITDTQKNEFVIEALGIAGFTKNPEFPVYTQELGMKTIVVDLSAGTSVYFTVDKKKVVTDDEYDTLAKVSEILIKAECGDMPVKTDPDIVVNVSKKDMSTDEDAPELDKQEALNPPAELVHSTAPPAQFIPQGTMIKNLVPGLKEIGKIKIGRKGATTTSQKGTEYRPPEKFNHFEIMTLYKDEMGDFIPDEIIMKKIGSDAKELDISLLYNDPSVNFFTRYNQYKGGKCMCSGDGQVATEADGNKIDCDPDTCPQFKNKKCKANGILSVILKDAPRLGGVYKFRTTSFNSIRSIMSSMFFIQSLTGGILANIPLKMTIAPMSVNPTDSKTAQTIYVVNLEYPGNMDDLRKETIRIMTERAAMPVKMAELEAQARVAITAPETTEDIQDVEAEFYPADQKDGTT